MIDLGYHIAFRQSCYWNKILESWANVYRPQRVTCWCAIPGPSQRGKWTLDPVGWPPPPSPALSVREFKAPSMPLCIPFGSVRVRETQPIWLTLCSELCRLPCLMTQCLFQCCTLCFQSRVVRNLWSTWRSLLEGWQDALTGRETMNQSARHPRSSLTSEYCYWGTGLARGFWTRLLKNPCWKISKPIFFHCYHILHWWRGVFFS